MNRKGGRAGLSRPMPTMQSSHLIKPNLRHEYPRIVSGKGVYLFDAEGRRYMDGCSGAIVANLGHGVTEIAEAMARQAHQVAFVYRTQFTSEASETLAARLAALAPGDLNWVFFVNSGSEATETAARVAIQFWREKGRPNKVKILGRQMSYHGMTLGALSMSGHPLRRRDYGPLLHNLAVAPPAHCYRCPFQLQPDTCGLKCADAWEPILRQEGPDTVAAIIVEPVVGAAGGAVPAPPGYLSRLRALCDRYEVLLIADEVMTGMGRTGKWFGCDHEGVVPDLLVLGKGMSAGYTPMSAVLVRTPLVEEMRSGSGAGCFGHTYSGNPLSAAICLAVVDCIEKYDLVRAARERGEELRAALVALAQEHRIVGDVRGQGLLLGLELVRNRQTRESYPASAAVPARLVRAALDRGLVIYPAGGPAVGDSVLIAPPLTITSPEIGELVKLLGAALTDVEQQLSEYPGKEGPR